MIHTKIESKRGCGYRKPGGIYLVCDGAAKGCYKLPIPLTVCPCCNTGIKPTRGFTWINSNLFSGKECEAERSQDCISCAANLENTKMGLIWIGEKFYTSAADFIRESNSLGISRRISQVPKDFKVGETWIALAHRKSCTAIDAGGNINQSPGIFSFFRPQRIEYIVKGSESAEEIKRLEDRGFTLINVIRDTEAQTKLL